MSTAWFRALRQEAFVKKLLAWPKLFVCRDDLEELLEIPQRTVKAISTLVHIGVGLEIELRCSSNAGLF